MIGQTRPAFKFSDLFRFLRDECFFAILGKIDKDLAEMTRRGRCRICGDRLHRASYPRRSLPGLPAAALEHFHARLSFCCAHRDCRKRATPPSVVFFHGRRYPSFLMVLVGVFQDGERRAGLLKLEALLGVDLDLHPNTISRWREWWEEVYGESGFARRIRGFVPPVDGRFHLCQVVHHFLKEANGMLDVLRLHAPLSTRSVDPEQALRWAIDSRRGRETAAF